MRCLTLILIGLLMALSASLSNAEDDLVKYFQKEFVKQQSSTVASTKPEGQKQYPCPPYVPKHVCDIIQFFKPLPFTYEEEKSSRTDPVVKKRVRSGLISNASPFEKSVKEASRLFDVPEPVIISVINTESGGNPQAKNPRSSAKGLMQTIDSTFSMAKRRLVRDYGVTISHPYDSRSSIFAGTWYLSYVYGWAAKKDPSLVGGRDSLNNWEKALMNYYLGPGHEKYLRGKLVVYPNGHIEQLSNAKRYVTKIMTFAETVSG